MVNILYSVNMKQRLEWTKEIVLEEALKYICIRDWRKASPKTWDWAVNRPGIYQECIKHMSPTIKKKKDPTLPKTERTAEHRANLSKALKGRIFSEEHRAKIGQANSKRVLSENTKRKIGEKASIRNKGLPLPKGMKKRNEHILIDSTTCKKCSVCNEIKPLSNFGKNTRARWDGLTYECKVCRNVKIRRRYVGDNRKHYMNYAVSRRRDMKKQLVEYKGNKCQHCNIQHIPDLNTSIFQFHHRDPSEKDFAVSEINMSSFDNIKEELDKCDMLCSNCHHIEHWKLKHKEIIWTA